MAQDSVSRVTRVLVCHYPSLRPERENRYEEAAYRRANHWCGHVTLLDSSALLLVFEGGHGRLLNNSGDTGAGIGTHCTENMAMLVAGRAGGLKPGKHIVKTGVHAALVTISAMKAVGHKSETLGLMRGTVPELFT